MGTTEGQLQSLAAHAHAAYTRGDQVFQCAIDLAAQTGLVAPMMGTSSRTRQSDPSDLLNAVCAQGWEVVSGTAVFVPHTQESRNKFMSSGQQVAISGAVIGYYLFRRRG